MHRASFIIFCYNEQIHNYIIIFKTSLDTLFWTDSTEWLYDHHYVHFPYQLVNPPVCLSVCLLVLSLTYLLTPWCRVLLEKLTGLQLVKKFPAYHGTRRFITAPTSVRHLSLSWVSPIPSIYPHPTSWRTILILSTHLRLGLSSGYFPPVSLPRPYTHLSPHPYAPHAQPISFSRFYHPHNIGWGVQII